MRRRGLPNQEVNLIKPIELDSNNHELIYAQQRLRLTTLEFQLVQLFITQPSNAVISRKELADSLWKDEAKAEEGRALDLLISRLREKLNSLSPSLGKLVNRYGQGYAFERNDSQ